MSQKPSILVLSTSNTQPKSIIKLITNTQTIQEDPLEKNKIIHPWFIDTKYYTAEVELIGIDKNYKCSEEFYENIEALIIHFDSNKSEGLLDLDMWNYIDDNCEPEIKLLLTNYCNSNTKVPRNEAVKWCLDHGFELVELYPETTTDCDEDIIEEKVGVERVVEALQAHLWSNLVMKESPLPNKKPIAKELKVQENLELKQESLEADENDDFSDLFSRLVMMRDSLQTMPMNQRKKCAEEMVTAFWKAIGGDEDEISDI